MHATNRRDFLKTSSGLAAASLAAGTLTSGLFEQRAVAAGLLNAEKKLPFKISLAEWSLHRTLFDGKLDNLDFPLTAKRDYGIEAVEYVNQFFKDKAKNSGYLTELNKRSADQGIRNVLIMIDDEGRLGDPDKAKQKRAIENHYKWVEAAKTLGCHAIRVNAHSHGSYDEQMKLVSEGLRPLVEFGASHEISVIVENHGGISSNGAWLAGVMRLVNNPRCGTLPDFGNFKEYDRYKGVAEMMPYAKGVSAKSYDFNDKGECIETNYYRMMKIVLDSGYHGHVGIEYEGKTLSEPEGIRATKRLLDRIMEELKATA